MRLPRRLRSSQWHLLCFMRLSRRLRSSQWQECCHPEALAVRIPLLWVLFLLSPWIWFRVCLFVFYGIATSLALLAMTWTLFFMGLLRRLRSSQWQRLCFMRLLRRLRSSQWHGLCFFVIATLTYVRSQWQRLCFLCVCYVACAPRNDIVFLFRLNISSNIYYNMFY